MARADRHCEVAPDSEILASLLPETDIDRQELALWLEDLLHRIHTEVH